MKARGTQPVGTPPAQACQNCHAEAKYRTWENVHGAHGPLSVSSDTFMGSTLTALVCRKCGYVQLFVSPQMYYNGELRLT